MLLLCPTCSGILYDKMTSRKLMNNIHSLSFYMHNASVEHAHRYNECAVW